MRIQFPELVLAIMQVMDLFFIVMMKETMPFCSEAWDVIARYIYTGLQGGSIMNGWMKEENIMITFCSDGTRPVIFKIGRIDYENE